MEARYSKLYKKYEVLKKEKESQFDKLNHDQEVKFLNFAAAADDMIQFLKSENDKLDGQVDQLKYELACIRASTDDQRTHFQKLLTKGNQKNTELSEEILRLQKEHVKCSRCTTCNEIGLGLENSHDPPAEESHGISLAKPTKKRKSIDTSEAACVLYVDAEFDRSSDQLVPREKSNGAPSIQQPACCQRKSYSSDTSSCSCLFQLFVEFAVGLKVAPLIKSDEQSMQAHHQSSGYTFSLTWITNSNGEVELLYRPSSLGTFKRVAPEWMKETLMFNTSMCPLFLERVSRVINS